MRLKSIIHATLAVAAAGALPGVGQGIAWAQLQPGPARSDTTFTVGDIRIEGLQRISEGTVYNYLPVNIGDQIDQRRRRRGSVSPVPWGLSVVGRSATPRCGEPSLACACNSARGALDRGGLYQASLPCQWSFPPSISIVRGRRHEANEARATVKDER